MKVYNKSGNEVTDIYNVSGNSLDTAYNFNGNDSYTKTYSINNVVPYYRTPVQEMKQTIDGLSDDWQSLVFVTDTHGSANKQHSQAMALYLLANSKAKMIVLGGDYSSGGWTLSQYSNYMSPYLNSGYMDDIYAVLGNHEAFSNSERQQSTPQIYQDFLSNKTVQGVPESLYFYVDDTQNKTRFMFINTSDYKQYDISDNQLAWIRTNSVLPSSEWSLIVFGHENIIAQSISNYNLYIVGQGTPSESDVSKKRHIMLQNAIMNSNGNVIGYFCGHQHIDLVSNVTIDGRKLYEATLLCDKFENDNYYSNNPELYPENDRVVGTNTEQAISVISFNTKTKDVVIRRIGAGRNQTMTYNYGTEASE